jgi:hypothetical protein
MDPLTHTLIATGLCAVFFYSGYAYAWHKLRTIIEHQIELMASEGRIVIEDDNEDTARDDRLG